MVELPAARIRPYVQNEDDNKLVRFYIGRANMEGLAKANFRVYTNPLWLALWVALASALIQYFSWWPRSDLPWWSWLKPVPAFAAWSVPLMFAVDWYNRPSFEERTQEVLRRPDIADLYNYYFERSPASGLWILEYKNKFVGFIAVDASLDSTSEHTVLNGVKSNKDLKDLRKKGTSKIATIRHFYTHEEYRPADVQDDLLEYAIKHAFTADKTVKTIRAVDCAIDSWASKALQRQGFVFDKVVGKIGILGWRLSLRTLTRERWAGLKKSESDTD